MGKTKRNRIQPAVEEKKVVEVDCATKQSFFNSAISDISGHIKFLDTKVSIIMSALGIIIAGTINCRHMIYNTNIKIKNYSLLHTFFWILLLLYALNIFLVYCWGLFTIKAHECNINFKSLWFIKDSKEKYSFETYKVDVEKMTAKDIIDTLAAELYKLNDIYRQKASTTKKTIASFVATLIVLSLIMGICIFAKFKLGGN